MTPSSCFELPEVNPRTLTIPFEIHPFKERRKLDGKEQAIHFFTDDYAFDGLLWNKLYPTTRENYINLIAYLHLIIRCMWMLRLHTI